MHCVGDRFTPALFWQALESCVVLGGLLNAALLSGALESYIVFCGGRVLESCVVFCWGGALESCTALRGSSILHCFVRLLIPALFQMWWLLNPALFWTALESSIVCFGERGA